MIRARHRPFFTWFFRVYSVQMIRRHFSKYVIKSDFEDQGKPVLLLGNHFSWWDGFIANLLNIKIFGRRFHVMMLEEQLKDRMFLNKAGAYSIRQGKRSAIESLDYTADLLKQDENLVVFYPQGEFQSVYHYPLNFQPGISKMIKRLQNPLHLVFYVALIDYFSSRKPLLTVYLHEISTDNVGSAEALQAAYNDFLADCIKQQMPE